MTLTAAPSAAPHESTPPHRDPGRRWARRPELLLVAAASLPAVAIYGLHWRRGYFLDDPALVGISFEHMVASIKAMRARPLGTLLVFLTYIVGEPSGRLLSAVILASTAALAALLIWRTTQSRYGSVVTALLVLYPLLDWESALYWYAAIQYPAAALFGLAAAHAALFALRAESRARAIAAGLATAALATAAVACIELGVNFLFVLPGIFVVECARRWTVRNATVGRFLGLAVAAVAAVAAFGAFIYIPETDFTTARGEVIVHPREAAARVVRVWLPAMRNLTVGPQRLGIHREALSLGLANLREPLVLGLYAAAVVSVVVALRRCFRSMSRRQARDGARGAAVMIVVGVGLFLAALWLPAALLAGQFPVTRLLFTPWTGLAIAFGSCVAWFEAMGRVNVVKGMLVAAMVTLLGFAVTLDGYGELFRLRDQRNDRQVDSWLALVEDVEPVPADIRIVSLYGNDRLLGERSPVDETLAGITETPWALSREVTDSRGQFVQALGGHPFVPVCFERTAEPQNLRVKTMFNDEVIPITSLLAAEIDDGKLRLVDAIVFGETTIALPLATRVDDPALERLTIVGNADRACRYLGAPAS